jgi:hypothetical protein
MRILTWNCNRGPATKKLPLIAPLKPTISILQECPRPKEDDRSTVWFGDNPRLGITVSATSGYCVSTVRPAKCRDIPSRYKVTGPISFLLLAVWAKTDLNFPVKASIFIQHRLMKRSLIGQIAVIVKGS